MKRLGASLWLGIGTMAGQALVFLASPWLTRLYDARGFALFGVLSGLWTCGAALASLRLDQAVLLEAEEDGAAEVLRVAVLASVAVAGLAGVIAGALHALGVWRGLGVGSVAMAVLTGFGVLLGGLYQPLAAWQLRRHRAGRVGAYQTLRSGLGAACQLGAGLARLSALSLPGGQLLGQLAATLALGFGAPLGGARRPVAVLRRHRALVLFGTPQAALRVAAVALPSLLLPLCAGAAEAGWFWLAWRVLSLPGMVVTESLRGPFLRHATSLRGDRQTLRRDVLRLSFALAAAAIPVIAVLFGAGGALFAVVFGPAWAPSGRMAAWLALGWAAETAQMPVAVAIAVLGLQRAQLAIEGVGCLLRAAALLGGAALGGAALAIPAYALAAGVTALTMFVPVLRALPRRVETVWQEKTA